MTATAPTWGGRTWDLPKPEEIGRIIGIPFENNGWHNNCHAVSLAFLRKGLVEGRVARGSAEGVGVHSWIVLAQEPGVKPNCYLDTAQILDPTIHCWHPGMEPLWQGIMADGMHHLPGRDSIWNHGCPLPGDGPPLELVVPDGPDPMGRRAFLKLLETTGGGPVTMETFRALYHGPLQGWPAGALLDLLLDQHPDFETWVPIDVVGMLTERNPDGLYW